MDGPTSREVAMIVDAVHEVKESIATLSRDMNAKMSVLVSQREFDRTRDDLTIDIGEVRGQIASGLMKHDADIDSVRQASEDSVKALKEALEAAERRREAAVETARKRRRDDRWAALGALLTVVGLALTAIVIFH